MFRNERGPEGKHFAPLTHLLCGSPRLTQGLSDGRTVRGRQRPGFNRQNHPRRFSVRVRRQHKPVFFRKAPEGSGFGEDPRKKPQGIVGPGYRRHRHRPVEFSERTLSERRIIGRGKPRTVLVPYKARTVGCERLHKGPRVARRVHVNREPCFPQHPGHGARCGRCVLFIPGSHKHHKLLRGGVRNPGKNGT